MFLITLASCIYLVGSVADSNSTFTRMQSTSTEDEPITAFTAVAAAIQHQLTTEILMAKEEILSELKRFGETLRKGKQKTFVNNQLLTVLSARFRYLQHLTFFRRGILNFFSTSSHLPSLVKK